MASRVLLYIGIVFVVVLIWGWITLIFIPLARERHTQEEILRLPVASALADVSYDFDCTTRSVRYMNRTLEKDPDGICRFRASLGDVRQTVLAEAASLIHGLHGSSRGVTWLTQSGEVKGDHPHLPGDLVRVFLDSGLVTDPAPYGWVNLNGEVYVAPNQDAPVRLLASDSHQVKLSRRGALVSQQTLITTEILWSTLSGVTQSLRRVDRTTGDFALLDLSTKTLIALLSDQGIQTFHAGDLPDDFLTGSAGDLPPLDLTLWSDKVIISTKQHYWRDGIRHEWQEVSGSVFSNVVVLGEWSGANGSLCRVTADTQSVRAEVHRPDGTWTVSTLTDLPELWIVEEVILVDTPGIADTPYPTLFSTWRHQVTGAYKVMKMDLFTYGVILLVPE